MVNSWRMEAYGGVTVWFRGYVIANVIAFTNGLGTGVQHRERLLIRKLAWVQHRHMVCPE